MTTTNKFSMKLHRLLDLADLRDQVSTSHYMLTSNGHHKSDEDCQLLNLRGIPCSRPAYRFINVAMAEPLWTLDSRVPLWFGMGIYLKLLEHMTNHLIWYAILQSTTT